MGVTTGVPAGRRGTVTRVNGPLVDIDGLGGAAALYDVVEVGDDRFPGEIVAISGERVTAQLYEYTAGLAPGAPAVSRRLALSARLGPGLLGGVFDGMLRPIGDAAEWLAPRPTELPPTGRWRFAPGVEPGATLEPGQSLGTATAPGRELAEPVLVPPTVRGPVEWVAAAGELGDTDPVARVGGRDVGLASRWPVRTPRPYRRRLETPVPLVTGQRVLDLLHPVAKGSTAAVIGGFGTGKTVLLQQIAKWCDADVIVYVGCGERGNELADAIDELRRLVDPRTGRPLTDRTVIVANTSNMAVMAREASIHTAMTVAEYFRDQGLDAVLIADSTSRWAEALREFASRAGELPAEEGYPAGLASALAAFYERAGRVETLDGRTGSVTVIAAVSPPGGDLGEPVSAHTQRFVRSLWTLDRDLAYARHYPAISWRTSFSRDAPTLATWHARHGDAAWGRRRLRLETLLTEADRLQSVADLVGVGALPGRERTVLIAARLARDAVLQQSASSPNDAYCTPEKQAALADAVLSVSDAAQRLVETGVPAALLEDFGALIRARDELAPDDAAGVARRRDELLARLGELT